MKARSKNYEIRISYDPRDEIFIARVPELKGVHSHGKTQAAAVKAVGEAIDLALEVMEEEGEEIPVPLSEQQFSGKLPFRPGKELHRALVIESHLEDRSANEILSDALRIYLAAREMRMQGHATVKPAKEKSKRTSKAG